MEAQLNAAAFSDPNSLQPSITIVDHAIPSFPMLVDSGSTHCFVDLSFANMNNLSCYTIPPIVLRLFDGTTTTIIAEATDHPIQFPSGNVTPMTFYVTPMTFYVTPLDSDCRIILRHNWLTQYNPLIDWVLSSIEFRTPLQQVPALSSLPDHDAQSPSTLRLNPSSVSSPSPTDSPKAPGLQAPPIALINAAAYIRTCKLEGSIQFSIQL